MKRLAIVAMLMSLLCLGVNARGKQPIALKDLPEPVKKEILKNFTQEQIQLITAEKEFRNYEYTFMMADGTKLEYDKRAQLRKIKKLEGVDEKFLPKVIVEYIKATLPNAIVTEYKREGISQKVELSDKMELVFNRKGKFLRIED